MESDFNFIIGQNNREAQTENSLSAVAEDITLNNTNNATQVSGS